MAAVLDWDRDQSVAVAHGDEDDDWFEEDFDDEDDEDDFDDDDEFEDEFDAD